MEPAYEAWVRANRRMPHDDPIEQYLSLEFPGESEGWLRGTAAPRPGREPRGRDRVGPGWRGWFRRWIARAL
jgi:hypothetical protein